MADAFIIGGGPAGLAAAIALRRKGLRVVLADARTPPIDKACGEGLMPDGLSALALIGVSIPGPETFPFRGIRFVSGPDRVDASFPNGSGFGVRRTTLHSTLVEQAERSGVEMLWGASVTGISRSEVHLKSSRVAARWIIGADGCASSVRKWAGLDGTWRNSQRFGFRRHYQLEPWTDCMEIHWGTGCQIYATPVSTQEMCIALISRNHKLRIDEALPEFPELMPRLHGKRFTSDERGGVTATRRLRQIRSGNVVLIGDAAGSVDAITGEGLCLAFKQAVSLASALAADDLTAYESEQRWSWCRPAFMADVMLRRGESPRLRSRAIRAFARNPDLFASMLAMHIGELHPARFAIAGASLGLRILTI